MLLYLYGLASCEEEEILVASDDFFHVTLVDVANVDFESLKSRKLCHATAESNEFVFVTSTWVANVLRSPKKKSASTILTPACTARRSSRNLGIWGISAKSNFTFAQTTSPSSCRDILLIFDACRTQSRNRQSSQYIGLTM